MNKWTNYDIYFSELDRLITDCIFPFVSTLHPEPIMFFWERHYAGGNHLKLRLLTAAEKVSNVERQVLDHISKYIEDHPSPPQPSYNIGYVERLLQYEQENVDDFDLEYKNNYVVESEYHRFKDKYVSREAVILQEAFYSAIMPLVVEMLNDSESKQVHALKIFFLHSLLIAGNYCDGCMSFKSHWEGFKMHLMENEPRVLEIIRKRYLQNREKVYAMMLHVLNGFELKCFRDDRVLQLWMEIEERFLEKSYELLLEDNEFLPQYDSSSLQKSKEKFSRYTHKSRFYAMMYEDTRFWLSLKHDKKFSRNRILTNFLYLLASSLGLNAIDKFNLCYIAHKAVEDYYDCDTLAILERIISETIDQYSTAKS